MKRFPKPGEALSLRILALRAMLAVVLLLGVAAVLIVTGVDLVWFRDVGYPDSASLLRAAGYLRNGQVYPDPNQPPYLVSLYGPLFYILLSLPVRLAASLHTMRVMARLFIAGFWIGTLVLLFLVVWRCSRSMNRGLGAVAFAAAPAVVAHWTTQIRGDLPGTAFSLLSIYCVLAARRHWGLLAGAAFSVLALLCKQTFIAAPLSILIFLLWRRRFGRALMWAVAVGLGTLAGYGVVVLSEPFAWRELTALGKSIYSVHTAILLAPQGLWNAAALFAFFGIIAACGRHWRDELLLLLYCVLAWTVALSLLVQVGGSTNYFLEPLAASAALASVTLPAIEQIIRSLSRVVVIPALLALTAFFVPLLQEDWNLFQESSFRIRKYVAFSADWDNFVSSVAGHSFLSSYPDVTIYSRTPQVPDPLLNSVLARRGAWSWRPVVEELNRSDYELLAMYPYFLRGSGQYRGFQYWDHTVFDAILRNYQLAGLCAGMEIWTPRNPRPASWKYLVSEGCRPPSRR